MKTEFKKLRQELVDVYMQPTFDVDKSVKITNQLRELLMDKNYIVEAVRQCYNADFGVLTTARKLKMDVRVVREYYEQFIFEKRQCKINLGDPEPGRSALTTYQPWKPVYDDKPVTVKEQSYDKQIIGDGKIPTADHVGIAVVTAAKFMDVEAEGVATGVGSKRRGGLQPNLKTTRARTYAFLILRHYYPHTSRNILARLVGVKNAKSATAFSANFDHRLKYGLVPWFKQEDLDKLIAGVAEWFKVPVL